MKIIQTYQQGSRHKANNQPCEDRTYALSKNGVDVIALADGAGSSKYTHSAIGAECVTNVISEFFCNNFDKFYEKEDVEELRAVVMTVCQRALKKKAEELELDSIARFSSTLLCVAIKGERVIVCHIGDGVIGKLTPEGTQVVSAPENGEFASTTYFITNPRADEYIHIIKEEKQDAVSYFLMSDGTSDYVYNKFDTCFYDAAKKMALMSIVEEGQSKLENIITKYMIERDPKSDDCSFICISLEDRLPETDALLEEKEESGYEDVYIVDINTEMYSETEVKLRVPEFKKPVETTKPKPEAKKKRTKLIVVLVSVIIIVVALVAALLIGGGNKNDGGKASSTAVESKVSGDVSAEKFSETEKYPDKEKHSEKEESTNKKEKQDKSFWDVFSKEKNGD